MIPFPGQSVGAQEAYSAAALWFLGGDIHYRDGSHVIASGDDWYVFAYHDSAGASLLEVGDPTALAVSWVVEVLSGSGTLDLYDLDDSGFTEPTTAGAYTTSLGTITVTGPGTYTLPTSTFTADAIRTAGLTGGTLALRLACTAGTVEVQQVKLRVWPVGGPVGGWSEPYTGDPGVTGLNPTSRDSAVPDLNDIRYPSQADFRDALASATLGVATDSTTTLARSDMAASYNPETDTHEAFGAILVGYLTRNVANLRRVGPGTLGVDWLIPPEEVEGDADAYVFDPTGTDSVEWTQPVVTCEVSSQASDVSGLLYDGTLTLGADQAADEDAAGTSVLSLLPGTARGSITPTGTVPLRVDFTLPEFDPDTVLRLVVTHTGFFTDITETAGGSMTVLYGLTADGSTFDRLAFSWTPGAYRYWSATVTTAQPLRLMQRGDGLGMGSGRVYATGTRQASTRVFGSL